MWRPWRPEELRFAALLTPQGRVLFDLFLLGRDDGCWIDCAADRRDDLITRLTIYRLRAKVTIAAVDAPVFAAWGGGPAPGAAGRADPRLPELGWRGYGDRCAGGRPATSTTMTPCRLRLGVPGAADWGADAAYPIEANFDLLNGIDFKKGCFVGQETTSRMKRRGVIKSRMAPVEWRGPTPQAGDELLTGELRAGEVRSVGEGLAMALLRLDRLEGALGYAGGGEWTPRLPSWVAAAAPA